MQSFRGKKGPDAGNTSSVFYSAYVFFEKIRIKQGKPKSQKRKEMEEVWGPDGFDIENANKGLVLTFLSLFSSHFLFILLHTVSFIAIAYGSHHIEGSSAGKARLSPKTNVAKCTSTHHLESHKEQAIWVSLPLLTSC